MKFPKVPLLLPPLKKVQPIPVGRFVRIQEVKQRFDKGDVRAYSLEVYEIIRVERNKHYLRDTETGEEADRAYDRHELQEVQKPVDENKEADEYEDEVKEQEKEQRFVRRVRKADVEPDVTAHRNPQRPKITRLRSGRIVADAPQLEPVKPKKKVKHSIEKEQGFTSKEKNYIKGKK
jgi:hypothetical protein